MRVECESFITFNGFVYLVMAWLFRETLEQSIPYKKTAYISAQSNTRLQQ